MTPTYVPKFTYIIPFRFRQDRIIPLKRVLDWLSGFQGVEVIVVEQDSHSKIQHLNLKCTHVFIKSEIPFNKSWAFNVGIKRAQSSIIVFGEADFIMNPMDLIECLKDLDKSDCIIPTDRIVKLNAQDSLIDTNAIFNIKASTSKTNIFDGISIFKKESIIRIGGWNEDMIGLGYENEFNELKVKTFLTHEQKNYIGYHFFHYPEFDLEDSMKRNKKIYDLYNNDKNLLGQHISMTAPKIGIMSRFT